jgi:hypothetical protein
MGNFSSHPKSWRNKFRSNGKLQISQFSEFLQDMSHFIVINHVAQKNNAEKRHICASTFESYAMPQPFQKIWSQVIERFLKTYGAHDLICIYSQLLNTPTLYSDSSYKNSTPSISLKRWQFLNRWRLGQHIFKMHKLPKKRKEWDFFIKYMPAITIAHKIEVYKNTNNKGWIVTYIHNFEKTH